MTMVFNSRKIKSALCLLAVIAVLLTSCGKGGKKDNTLRIAAGEITGNFNPFYAVSEGDKAVNSQVFRTIQRTGKNNKLINSVGSISYEYSGDSKTKYTVTIRDDLKFSDGRGVTIDDVIFFYYFCADASYDGVYSDFYLNDIEGIKEYYYDDTAWKSKLAEFEDKADKEKQIKKYIEKNYKDGADVTEIKGIRRVDDYTCTVTFNSRNINAVSALNAVIVSKAFYTAEYVKGSASVIKNFTTMSMGCGPYFVSNYNADSHKTELKYNTGYSGDTPDFTRLEYIDISGSKTDATDYILKGKADIIETTASAAAVNKLNGSSAKYFITNDNSYTSLFINTRTVENDAVRKQLMKACSDYTYLDKTYGSYYTKVYMPLSVRFEEYPAASNPYYSGDTISALLTKEVSKINIYCISGEYSEEKILADNMAEKLNSLGIKAKVVLSDYAKLTKDAAAGKADMWILNVPDGATCDKYDYYHSGGRFNLTGLSDAAIDTLTERIRSSTGFTEKKGMTVGLLNAIMEKAIEMPVYQKQIITAYSTETISPGSIDSVSDYDGYAYAITELKAAE
ncbi:MAG: ABC transporter substrate-binding protein [Clostridia bacterium]|nr:ABC transporter substrate-binding protein [Clostridia bacterium]